MRRFTRTPWIVEIAHLFGAAIALTAPGFAIAADVPPPFPIDPQQSQERTCFQTGQGWSPAGNLRSDVAIVYGIDSRLPGRIETWRERGYRIHVMTGVSWGSYQDYLYGRFDGIHHEDEAQTEANGNKISHGGDVYYMCPGTNFGKFLCVGVQGALDAGAEAIHLEEPEFWVRGGFSDGFKREWRSFYGTEWQSPNSSVDAQWRASKLKYFLYRRALQQVFDYVQAYNARTGRKVRCYVPTHSLLNYAHWRIVSPESSLARLAGCDGYIAQVWTGTSRTPNMYRGQLRERTFETAFLEYGAMQNLVRATGRRVWYLNDPVEDNPNHDWQDYKQNWQSTLVASLFQPEVWRYEVAPWPERVFAGRHRAHAGSSGREKIPPDYATELQVVMNALNDMNQPGSKWDSGSAGFGVLISDSLMFERGEPSASDPHLGHVYGLALPLLKRGIPVAPVQLENAVIHGYLDPFRVLFLTYQGQKPLGPEVHDVLARWVKAGGALVVVDDDSDPYNKVQEWWNSKGQSFSTPRQHLFEILGLKEEKFGAKPAAVSCGKGSVTWLHENPAQLANSPQGDAQIASTAEMAAKTSRLPWKAQNYLVLRRGPYVIAAGLDESISAEAHIIKGRFVNLFDPELKESESVSITPNSRYLLLDLDSAPAKDSQVLASACKSLTLEKTEHQLKLVVEGVGDTPGIVLISTRRNPKSVALDGKQMESFEFSQASRLLRIKFENESRPRELEIRF
jgi:hypothetical protein